MAAAYNKSALVFNLVLMLSLLLVVSMADGKVFDFAAVGFRTKASPPVCDSVFGIQSGNTCFAVEQLFNITAESFNGLNPNLDCDKLFVGQWVCVAGQI